jgi:mono/diheme cytochrome c family protein
MHRIAIAVLLALPGFALAGLARADVPAPLRQAKGQETVEKICSGCHTLNYIRMNSVFLDEAQWKAEVTKMRQIFGAPIGEDDQAEIIGYLTAQYSVTK